MIKKLLAAVLLTAAASSQAVIVTSQFGAPDPGFSSGETLLADFNGELAPGYGLTGGFGYRTGSTGEAAAPAGDTSRYLYVSSALNPNSATFTTAFDLSKISFYWGSIDSYNSVDVLGANGDTIYSVGGGLFPPADGNQFGASTNRRVTFTADNGEVITGLRFISTGVAFELDDIAGRDASLGSEGSVPEPASWALLVTGFGIVGAAARRRRTGTSVAA